MAWKTGSCWPKQTPYTKQECIDFWGVFLSSSLRTSGVECCTNKFVIYNKKFFFFIKPQIYIGTHRTTFTLQEAITYNQHVDTNYKTLCFDFKNIKNINIWQEKQTQHYNSTIMDADTIHSSIAKCNL